MKRILFISLLGIGLCPSPAQAQQAGSVKGQFEVTGSSPAMQVQYTLMRALPDNLVVQLQAGAPFRFEGAITDRNGRQLLQLPAEVLQGRYVQQVDISSLPAGQYFVSIRYGAENQESYRIPFTK
jgi:ABC-type arginine transport system permease subunit